MVPYVRSIGTAVFGTSGTLTVTQPAGRLAEDLLLLIIGCGANASVTPTTSTSAPWTLYDGVATSLGTTRGVTKMYSLISAGASDASATVSATPTGATACHQSAVIIAFGGVSFDATVATCMEATVNDDQTPSAATTSFTVSTDGTKEAEHLVVGVSFTPSNATTAGVFGSGYTQQVFTDNATGTTGCLFVATKTVSGSTSTATTVTFTTGAAVGLTSIAAKLIGAPSGWGYAGPSGLIVRR